MGSHWGGQRHCHESFMFSLLYSLLGRQLSDLRSINQIYYFKAMISQCCCLFFWYMVMIGCLPKRFWRANTKLGALEKCSGGGVLWLWPAQHSISKTSQINMPDKDAGTPRVFLVRHGMLISQIRQYLPGFLRTDYSIRSSIALLTC